MYHRKTNNAAELSEACRRAALSRKHNRGGRKRLSDVPSKTLRVDGRDYAVLRRYAEDKGLTLCSTLHAIAAHLVIGGSCAAHPAYAPEGWMR